MHAGPCSLCSATQAFIVDEALLPNYEYSNSVVPLTLTAALVPKKDAGFFGSGNERVPVKLGARVCAKCGKIDWFVRDLTVLERFAREGHGNVRRG